MKIADNHCGEEDNFHPLKRSFEEKRTENILLEAEDQLSSQKISPKEIMKVEKIARKDGPKVRKSMRLTEATQKTETLQNKNRGKLSIDSSRLKSLKFFFRFCKGRVDFSHRNFHPVGKRRGRKKRPQSSKSCENEILTTPENQSNEQKQETSSSNNHRKVKREEKCKKSDDNKNASNEKSEKSSLKTQVVRRSKIRKSISTNSINKIGQRKTRRRVINIGKKMEETLSPPIKRRRTELIKKVNKLKKINRSTSLSSSKGKTKRSHLQPQTNEKEEFRRTYRGSKKTFSTGKKISRSAIKKNVGQKGQNEENNFRGNVQGNSLGFAKKIHNRSEHVYRVHKSCGLLTKLEHLNQRSHGKVRQQCSNC